MDQMMQCFTEDDPFKDILIDLNTSRLVIHMLQNNAIQEVMQLNSEESSLKSVISYIRNNLHRNISLSELEKVACVSKSTLYRAFQNELGCSPTEFLKAERMKKAAKMLKSDCNITTCAFDLGFSSTAHFTRSFKAFFGRTPNSYRKDQIALAG
jgi:AraC-like DNA-binding protein